MTLGHLREVLADAAKLKHCASECFRAFDANQDGLLSLEELTACLHKMIASLGGNFARRDVEHYMRRFDLDLNHHLDQAEYARLYQSLLVAELSEQEPTPFRRDMFIARRKGQPDEYYTLRSVLGKGAFGVVRKIKCKTSGAVRVMKIVNKEKAARRGYPLDLILAEVDKLKALDHPALLRLFEYFVDDTAIYLVTDMLPGGDLLEAVEGAYDQRKILPEEWIRRVFLQVCEGVGYIHAKGIMHKDLKLENIMLCNVSPPTAVIIDVGLAELFPPTEADSFHSVTSAGTLATMAPEVIQGSFTAKCDVWSLGCCLFALLCHKPHMIPASNGKLEEFFYPYVPPEKPSKEQLRAYLHRQFRGPNLQRLRCSSASCSAAAEQMLRKLLTVGEADRPNMRQVLADPWLDEIKMAAETLSAEQVESVVQFYRASALEQAVLLDVASQLPLQKLQELCDLFESMDQDGNGMLDEHELADALQAAGLPADSARTAASCLVKGSGGFVEFSRFVAALVPSRSDLLHEQLRTAFGRLDSNEDGFLSRRELQRLLERGVCGSEHDGCGAEESRGASKSSAASEPRSKAARAARESFEALGGSRISFSTLQRHLEGLLP